MSVLAMPLGGTVSQREVPGLGNDTVRLIDATSGNETYTLPPNFAVGRKLVIRRSDSSGNTVTISIPPGTSLDGTTDGTKKVGADSEAWFSQTNPGAWESFGGSGAASLSNVSLEDGDKLRSQNALALQPWFAALANRDSALARCVVIGDSVSEGGGAGTASKSWLRALQDRMRSRFPTSGLTGGGIGYVPVYNVSGAVAVTNPWVVTGTSAAVDSGLNNGLGVRARVITGTGTLTLTVQGTSVDLLYLKANSSRVLGYSVDGGAVTTLDTNSGTGSASDTGVQRITLGSSGSHTLALTKSSGSDPYVEGVIVYDGDESKGIQFIDAAHYGWETTQYVDTTNNRRANHAARVASLGPHLVIIGLGENEYLHNVSSASLQANLVTMVTDIRAVQSSPKPSFLFVANFKATNASPLEPWANYVAAIYAAAASVGAAAIDASKRMPDIPGDVLGLYVDPYHPGPKGHSMFADIMTTQLSPA